MVKYIRENNMTKQDYAKLGFDVGFGISGSQPSFTLMGVKDICKMSFLMVPDGVTAISLSVERPNRSVELMSMPNSVGGIGNRSFCDFKNLRGAHLSNNITYIEDQAFAWCEKLTDINMPDWLLQIGNSAFAGCSSLTRIDLPERLTSIGMGAFANCSSLKDITIPDGVIKLGKNIFYGCKDLVIHYKGNDFTAQDFQCDDPLDNIKKVLQDRDDIANGRWTDKMIADAQDLGF